MLLGFKKRFKQPIVDGTKKFTIREKRKIEPKIGERLFMYTGLRTKSCEKITDEHRLVSIQLVDVFIQQGQRFGLLDISVDGRILDQEELMGFVVSDGFTDPNDFMDYWLEGEKPNGKGIRVAAKHDLVLHHWTELKY